MVDSNEILGFGIVAAIVGATFLFSHKPSSIADLIPVDQKSTHYHLWKTPDDGDGTLTIRSTDNTGRLGHFVLHDDELYTRAGTDKPPAGLTGTALDDWSKAHSSFYTASFVPDRYLIEPTLDWGTFAAVRPSAEHASGDSAAFEVGLRVSGLRLLYNTVSFPDLLVTKDAIGVGAGLFPPSEYFGKWWSHVGVEIGYVEPVKGGAPAGWLGGLAFSVHN